MKPYKFINFPESISIDEYNKEIQLFLKDIETIFIGKDFSLYLIGELGLPGVSDLDFLIIIDNFEFKSDILKIIKKYKLIDIPLFIKYSDIDNLEYFTHHYSFKYVGGKKINEDLFLKKNKNLFLIYSWKILFFSGLRNFYIPYYRKEINVKNMLSWINDLRYPIFYLSKTVDLDEDILNFIKEYEQFRNTWFSHKDKKKLSNFLEKSINISWKLIYILDNQLNIKNIYKNKIYGRFPTIFVKENNFEDYKKFSEKYFENISNIDRFLVLPNSLNYNNWNGEIKKDFDLILYLNKGFLKFSFEGVRLKIMLGVKKIIDFIKINIYEKYEKI